MRVSFLDGKLPDLVHSVAMQLEGGCDPAAARTLIPKPAEGAQLGAAFRTEQLNTHKRGTHGSKEEEEKTLVQISKS